MYPPKILFITTLLTFIAAISSYVWLIDNNSMLDYRSRAIDKVKIDFDGRKINLSVSLNQPQTCAQVINLLGVEQIPIKKKIYVPACTIIKDDFIKIVFEEQLVV